MNDFLWYILESAGIAAFFFIVYWLLLKRERSFHWQRLYLVLAILFPFILPAISINIHSEYQLVAPTFIPNLSPSLEHISIEPTSSLPSAYPTYLASIPIIIFFIGALIMTFRLGAVFVQLYRICRKIQFSSWQTYRLGISTDVETPCSFFHYILLPDDLREESDMIIHHESIHSHQLHTIDVLLVEVALIIQWFNPFLWQLRKALREVHEYLADEGVLKAGFSSKEYQLLLLSYSTGRQQFALANAINQLTIIKRINMMNTKKSTALSRFRYLAIVPMIAICLVISNCRTSMDVEPTTNLILKGQVYRAADQSPLIGAAIVVKGTNMGALTDTKGTFWLSIPPTILAENQEPALSISYIDLAPYTVGIEQAGEFQVWLANEAKESSHTFEQKDMEAELERSGKNLNLAEANSGETQDSNLANAFKFGAPKQPLFILDGEEIVSQEGLNEIDPNRIKEIKIFSPKNPEAFQPYLDNYGDKAKHGVILITTK